MSAQPLVIVGAGGHGREVLDVVRAINSAQPAWHFMGFIDDTQPDPTILDRLGVSWLATLEEFLQSPMAEMYVVGIGEGAVRRSVASRLEAGALRAATLVHPTATVGADVEVAEGSVLFSHTSMTTNIRLGRHVHVNRGSTVGHDCRVADFVTLHPLAALSGAVHVNESATLGAHSCVLQGLRIGAQAIVGAGAVVTRDVSPGATVTGVPARPRA